MFRSVRAVPHEIERESDPARVSLFTVNSPRKTAALVNGAHCRFGSKAEKLRMSKCLSFCPESGTYLPILELLPLPAFRERRHRGLAGRRVHASACGPRVARRRGSTPRTPDWRGGGPL